MYTNHVFHICLHEVWGRDGFTYPDVGCGRSGCRVGARPIMDRRLRRRYIVSMTEPRCINSTDDEIVVSRD